MRRNDIAPGRDVANFTIEIKTDAATHPGADRGDQSQNVSGARLAAVDDKVGMTPGDFRTADAQPFETGLFNNLSRRADAGVHGSGTEKDRAAVGKAQRKLPSALAKIGEHRPANLGAIT